MLNSIILVFAVVGIYLLLFSSFFLMLYFLGTKSGLKILRQYISKFELKIKSNPSLLALIYLVYVVLIGLISGGSYQFLITPLVAPLAILIGIFVWQWQEDVKNQTAKIELYKKKYNEKAEDIFGIYTKYEKSIQNLYRFFTDLRTTFKPDSTRKIDRSKEISIIMSKISNEIKAIDEIQLDLYNDAVLFYHLILNNSDSIKLTINVYSEAYKLMNFLSEYKYISEEISKFADFYQHNEKSEGDKEIDLMTEHHRLSPIIESFDFGFSQDIDKVVFTAPRKRFLEQVGS